MALTFTTSYVEDARAILRQYKALAEGAIEQITDSDLFTAPRPEMNSVALIVKHMAVKMRSRWTEFLTSDGEKPWRNRDEEFQDPPTLDRA